MSVPLQCENVRGPPSPKVIAKQTELRVLTKPGLLRRKTRSAKRGWFFHLHIVSETPMKWKKLTPNKLNMLPVASNFGGKKGWKQNGVINNWLEAWRYWLLFAHPYNGHNPLLRATTRVKLDSTYNVLYALQQGLPAVCWEQFSSFSIALHYEFYLSTQLPRIDVTFPSLFCC